MNEERLRRRRIRRRAAAVLAVAGLINLVSAVTPPIRNRLGELLGYVPLTIPQAATAGVALAGLALLMLSLALWKSMKWIAATVVMPIVGSHTQFIDGMRDTLAQLLGQQAEQGKAINAIARKLDVPDTGGAAKT